MSLLHQVLFVAWQNPASRRIFPVARLVDRGVDPRWELAYLRGAEEARANGFEGLVLPESFEEVRLSRDLPPLFTNRMMRRRRPDYFEHIRRLGLSEQIEAEIPILARSEGRRATDTIEVFGLPTFDRDRNVYRFFFFLRGVRHVPDAERWIARLAPGNPLRLEKEPTNPVDRLAIEVQDGGDRRIGWIPGTLVEELHAVRDRLGTWTVAVERVNPLPAPVQQRVLCRLELSAEGYRPFASDRYRPISPQATDIRIVPEALAA